MKINEVVKKTGMSKRTIYYYIEEQLITPEINKKNGYNIFSDEDANKLILIHKLRKADFSISDIRAILQYPNTAHYYLQKHIETLEQNQLLLTKKIDYLTKLDEALPINVSPQTFSHALMSHEFPHDAAPEDKTLTKRSTRLVSLYLWGTFLQDVPMTEYREFLWEKVLKLAAGSENPNIRLLKKYLYSLNANELDEEFSERNLHIDYISNMSPEDHDSFIKEMKRRLSALVKNPNEQKVWKDSYYAKTLPSTCLFDSDANELIQELSPRFAAYYENIHICCSNLYQWLQTEDGLTLYKELQSVFQGFIDLEQNHHAELAALTYLRH